MEENKLSEFTIYERGHSGRGSYGRIDGRYIIHIGKDVSCISKQAAKKMCLTVDSKIVFAGKDGKTYIAKLPNDSKIRGFMVSGRGGTKSLYADSRSLKKRGFEAGVYEIKSSIHSEGFDWFELYPFDIKKEQ